MASLLSSFSLSYIPLTHFYPLTFFFLFYLNSCIGMIKWIMPSKASITKRVIIQGVFGLHFHFLFSFPVKIYDILTSCLFVFLDLFKIIFIVTVILFYPKWGFCSQLKTLKTRMYCFHFLVVSCFHFHENVFRNLTKHIFITIFCFQWK